ncbi:MAG TPA: DUF4920 domain-containing protein [Bacteroidota bacterium]|nr:DUF4920 domain-containing protein [Bacteroidota bacterium]
MKRRFRQKFLAILLPLFVMTLSTALFAQIQGDKKSSEEKNKWTRYGSKITLKNSTPMKDLLGDKKRFGKKEILIESVISEVCQNKGCWMVLGDSDINIRVEFKDYKFFVPWDAEGKKVWVQGILSEKTIGAETAKHMAGEMKQSPIKKDEIKDQQTITVFIASGVAIEGGGEIGTEQEEVIKSTKEREGHKHENNDH